MMNFNSGWIETICGPMFSGKTEELLRRVRRAQIARQKIQLFKPTLDDRYSEDHVTSHDASKLPCFSVRRAHEIYDRLGDTTRVVGIDEIQFLDESIVTVVEKLAYRGVRVICAGLDLDYQGVPFGVLPGLLAVSEKVTKLTAVCTICGMEASRSQRLMLTTDENDESQQQILVGGKESYEPRCRVHHEKNPEAVNLSFHIPPI